MRNVNIIKFNIDLFYIIAKIVIRFNILMYKTRFKSGQVIGFASIFDPVAPYYVFVNNNHGLSLIIQIYTDNNFS